MLSNEFNLRREEMRLRKEIDALKKAINAANARTRKGSRMHQK
jgi:hypothetical protein